MKNFKSLREKTNLDEAFGSFVVPIPKQTLNGKKIGGNSITVNARTAREAIQKAAKELGVEFKFLKTGKVVKEDLEESVVLDEAGPTFIDGVKYQKEKKKKGFNKADWEWIPSKQLYKRVNESEVEGDQLEEGASDKIAKQMVDLNTKIDMIRADIDSTEDAYNDNDIDKAEFKKLDKEHNKRLSRAEADLDKLFAKFKSVKESTNLDEAFKRIPGNMINGELPRAARDLESVIRGLKAGNDFDDKAFNKVLADLNNVKKSAKSFKSADDVTTPYQYRADPRYNK